MHRRDATLAVADHNISTTNRDEEIKNPESKLQVETLERNVADFDVPYFPVKDARQGIVHIIGPEQGFTQPGMTIVCGDSHTATHGAFGALAFGIGTSEVEHVLATQTLIQQPSKNMRIDVNGDLPVGCTGKDLILAIIRKIGTAGGTARHGPGQTGYTAGPIGRRAAVNAIARAGLAGHLFKGRPHGNLNRVIHLVILGPGPQMLRQCQKTAVFS